MEDHQFFNLINQVKAIVERYKRVDELTGENFNIFRILNLEAAEVRMHSAFIAELLKPNGSHGQKDIFLRLFAKIFCFRKNEIDFSSCTVKVEENIGFVSEDKMHGGRIDIIIKDQNNKHIIIENKIYAGDQTFQLTRYFNYSNNADLIYLTLDGKSPDDKSKGDLEEGVHYKCYSYKHDILLWLEECRKEVAIYPTIREGLTHYINSIKYLTNQTTNQIMQRDINELLKLNLEASFVLADSLDAFCIEALDEFKKNILLQCELLSLECSFDINFENKNSGIWIKQASWEHVNIGFSFSYYDKDLIYGIVCGKDPQKCPIALELRNDLFMLPNNSIKKTNWWPWYRKLDDPYNDWSKFQAWQAILDGTMKDLFMEKVKMLIKMTEGLKM